MPLGISGRAHLNNLDSIQDFAVTPTTPPHPIDQEGPASPHPLPLPPVIPQQFFSGTPDDDTLIGTAGSDDFFLGDGGDDTVSGLGGRDNFEFGASLTSADRIDGGDGFDTVTLGGDYVLTFAATTMVNVEHVLLATQANYSLTMNDANVAAGQTLSFSAIGDRPGAVLTLNGAAETDGSFKVDGFEFDHLVVTGGGGPDNFIASNGDDIINGGGGDDLMDMDHPGTKTAIGGDGDDQLNFGLELQTADKIDGGAGFDTVAVNDNFETVFGTKTPARSATSGVAPQYDVTFDATTMINVEQFGMGSRDDTDTTFRFVTNDATVAAGQTLIVNAQKLQAADSLIFDGSAETNGKFIVNGGPGIDTITGGTCDDLIYGGNGNDIFYMYDDGNDTMQGGAGNDDFEFRGAFTAADSVNGGTGSGDTLVLQGDYTGPRAVVFTASTMVNVEIIDLLQSNKYDLTTNDATVASGQTLTVDGSTLGSVDSVTFNGSAELDGHFYLVGGAGADLLAGGQSSDTIDLSKGVPSNNDIGYGFGGNDTFILGASLASATTVNGGGGFDTATLAGNYFVTFGPNTMQSVELLSLAAGFNYNLTTNDATVIAGTAMRVDASALDASSALDFNGGAETNGTFIVTGGAGNDFISGGAGDDVVSGGAGNDGFDMFKGGNDTVSAGAGTDQLRFLSTFTAADTVDGGGGFDTLILGAGDYTGANAIVFTATTMINVEEIVVQADHSYQLTTNDATVAAGQTLEVSASTLLSGTNLAFYGGGETDGRFDIIGGAGDDGIVDGAGNDVIDSRGGADSLGLYNGGKDTVYAGDGNDIVNFHNTLTAADRVDGGNDNDVLALSGDYTGANALVLSNTTVTNVEQFQLSGGFSYYITLNDATVAAGESLWVAAASLAAFDSLRFDASADTDGRFNVFGGAGDDTLIFGAHFTTGDALAAGAGFDILVLDGDYGSDLVLGPVTILDVEDIEVLPGHDYHLTTNDLSVAAGATLEADGSTLHSNDTFYFDGSAETDGKFLIQGGAGNDTLMGGRGNDTIDAGRGTDIVSGNDGNDVVYIENATATVDGGADIDIVKLDGAATGNFDLTATTLANVEILFFVDGYNYNAVMNDANVTAGATMYINGETLTGGHKFSFDGGAETDGNFNIADSAGNDTITGGAKNDTISGIAGGDDAITGGGGGDYIYMGAALTAADHIDGGAGNDTLDVDGDYSAGVKFRNATLKNIETIRLDPAGAFSTYKFTTVDANVAAGATLIVDASVSVGFQALIFNGSLEKDGNFDLRGGKTNDVLTGGAGNDQFTGGLGADMLTGNAGADRFIYASVAESTGTNFDIVKGFDGSVDKFDLWLGVTGVDSALATGRLRSGHFDSDLAAVVDGTHLAANHAVLFSPSSGNDAGKTFLIVDVNGTAAYQAGQDLVIRLDSALHLDSLTVGDFV